MGGVAQFVPPQVLYDDSDETAFTYGGGQDWDKVVLTQWYGQTTVYPAFALDNIKNPAVKAYGTLTLQFEGIAAAFVGNTPGVAWSQTALASIDGGEPYNITYPGPAPVYVQWYKTPTLPPGNHTVTLTQLEGPAVDYAIVDVAPNTKLTNRTVVIDDDHPDIKYSGSWTQDPGVFYAGDMPGVISFGNRTHSTSTVGDKIAFSFSGNVPRHQFEPGLTDFFLNPGTRLEVYGIFNWAQPGVLGVQYTIDGIPFSRLYPVTATSPGYRLGYNYASNFLFFSSEDISPGEHTVIITVTQAENIAFAVDYITYNPNYESFDVKPSISPPTFPTTSSSSTFTSSGLQATQDTSTRTGDSQNDNRFNSTSKDTVIILGSVLGSVAAVAVFLLVVLLWRRHRKRLEEDRRASAAVMFQEGPYPDVGEVWRLDPQLRQGFAPGDPRYTRRTTSVTPYLNVGPNSQPVKQRQPSPGLTRSASDCYLPYTHSRREGYQSSGQLGILRTSTMTNPTPTAGASGSSSGGEVPPGAPPAYDTHVHT